MKLKLDKLKLISTDSEYHGGYGAGDGAIYTEVYECPCGKGTVKYVKDDIPGFRDSDIYCNCDICKKLF